jgi:hypothetical protein
MRKKNSRDQKYRQARTIPKTKPGSAGLLLLLGYKPVA